MSTDNQKLEVASKLLISEFEVAYSALLTKAMRERENKLHAYCNQYPDIQKQIKSLTQEYSQLENPYFIDDARRSQFSTEMKKLFPGHEELALAAMQFHEINSSCFMLADSLLQRAASRTLKSWENHKEVANSNYKDAVAQLTRHFLCAGIEEGVGSVVAKAQIAKFENIAEEAIYDGLGVERVGRSK